jgi:butyryl-CoA dehydrogenase
MLLAQKAYTEGGMSLCLYGSNLIDRINTCTDATEKQSLTQLLDLLTPVLKAWPSEYGPKANDLGIQVLGGSGYTREYYAEQFWRDNRLNPIHEGTNGIQALDLTFRKLWQNDGHGLSILKREVEKDLSSITTPETAKMATKLVPYLSHLHEVVVHLSKTMRGAEAITLSGNAQAVMNIFSTIVVSWIWIRQASAAEKLLGTSNDLQKQDYYKGKIQAAKYFMSWELPTIARDIGLLKDNDDVCTSVQPAWF